MSMEGRAESVRRRALWNLTIVKRGRERALRDELHRRRRHQRLLRRVKRLVRRRVQVLERRHTTKVQWMARESCCRQLGGCSGVVSRARVHEQEWSRSS